MCRIMPRQHGRGRGRGRGGGLGPIPQVSPPLSPHQSDQVEQLDQRNEGQNPEQSGVEGSQLRPFLEVLARLGPRQEVDQEISQESR